MHIPYENGGGTGFDNYGRPITTQERPEEPEEDPIDEVVNKTLYEFWAKQDEESWENNDIYISGDKLDNQGKD